VPALELVANRPIIRHVLDALAAAEVHEVIIAGTADVLIDVRAGLGPGSEPSLRLEYAVAGEPFDTLDALRASAPLVGAAPCLAHLADGLLGEPLILYAGELHDSSLDLLLVGRRSPGLPVLCPSVAAVNGGAFAGDPECEAGIGVFGPGAFGRACQADARVGSFGLQVVADHLTSSGGCVEVRASEGWRRYRGHPTDLLEVNRIALDDLPAQVLRPPGNETRIEGRVQIDPSASVRASVIVGPVVIGAGADISNAYIGPYTSIGAGAKIDGAEIERSIISPGATVAHVGGRLVSSLVGRGARVFRDFSLPRAMRLCVSEGDQVALC
jgi:glucose-1-phosphate thymidylyltransferase